MNIIETLLTLFLQDQFKKKTPKDALIETDWFKQKAKEADEQAIQNLKEMLGK